MESQKIINLIYKITIDHKDEDDPRFETKKVVHC